MAPNRSTYEVGSAPKPPVSQDAETMEAGDPTRESLQHLPRESSGNRAAAASHFLDWTRVWIMAIMSFNHVMWLAALNTSGSPVYGTMTRPVTSTAAYLIARYVVGANLAYTFGLFFLRSGYTDAALLQSTGLWKFVVTKTRMLLVPIVVYEVVLYPLLLSIADGSSITSTFSSYFQCYTGLGQLQMSYIVLLLILTWVLVCMRGFWAVVRTQHKHFKTHKEQLLVQLVTPDDSRSPLRPTHSQSDLVICISENLDSKPTQSANKYSSTAIRKQVEGNATAKSHPPISYHTHAAYEPFSTRCMIATVLAFVVVQALVMWGLAVSQGIAWNVQGVIIQYCTIGQYVVNYFLGACIERYKALQRLPAGFGYWCLGLSVVLYTSAYVGTLFRVNSDHIPAVVAVDQSLHELLEQHVMSPWVERVPTVSLLTSPHAAPSGLLLSAPTARGLLLDCFVVQAWATLFTVGLLVVFRRMNIKPNKLGQQLINAAYAFYIIFPLVLVTLAKAFSIARTVYWHPFEYVAVVWPLCFCLTYALAIGVRKIPGAALFL